MPVLVCKQCGTEFKHPGRRPRPYCSRACFGKSRQLATRLGQGADQDTCKRIRCYENGAQQRGLAWELTYDKCSELFSLPCYLCGKPGPGGIDRIDSSQGYVVGNVAPCCADCNLFKGSVHLAAFLMKLKQVYEYCSERGYYSLIEIVKTLPAVEDE